MDKDLSEIAEEMIEWEEKKIPVHLGMKTKDVHDIKETYKGQPSLQR